jgi:hypothetical protein
MPIRAYKQGDQIILATPDDVRHLRDALRAFVASRRERPRHEWPARDRNGLHVATEVLGMKFSQGLTLTTAVWQACCAILGAMGTASMLTDRPPPLTWRLRSGPPVRVQGGAVDDD